MLPKNEFDLLLKCFSKMPIMCFFRHTDEKNTGKSLVHVRFTISSLSPPFFFYLDFLLKFQSSNLAGRLKQRYDKLDVQYTGWSTKKPLQRDLIVVRYRQTNHGNSKLLTRLQYKQNITVFDFLTHTFFV